MAVDAEHRQVVTAVSSATEPEMLRQHILNQAA